MRRILLFLLILLRYNLNAQTQPIEDSWDDDKYPFGLRMGTGVTMTYGRELKNPRPLLGWSAGLYYIRESRKKSKNYWQIEANFRFMGSNYANSGQSAYTKITLMGLQLPVYYAYKLSGNEKIQKHLIFGPQLTYYMRSVVYQGPEKEPFNRDNFFKTWDNLRIIPLDISPVFGYQVRRPRVTYQTALKVGVMNLNMNGNFILPAMIPQTGTKRGIYTIGIEFGANF